MATGITKSLNDESKGTTQVVETDNEFVAQGETITFSFVDPIFNPGDRISFTLSETEEGWIGINPELVSAGTAITTNTGENLSLGSGSTYLITDGATLTGSISMGGGMICITEGATVTGDISGTADFFSADGGSSLEAGAALTGNPSFSASFMRVDSSTTGGNVSSNSFKTTEINGNTITGNVSSNGDTNVTINNNTISGNLSITNSSFCKQQGNQVSGTNSGCPEEDG